MASKYQDTNSMNRWIKLVIFLLLLYSEPTNISSFAQLFIGMPQFQTMKLINIFMMEFISVYRFKFCV